jgi:hypothetical protein
MAYSISKEHRMKENEMRSVLIYGEEGTDLLEKLSGVPEWKLEPLGIPGGHEYCLSNGEEKVALHVIAPNVISTSNVLPHDWASDQDKANAVLKKLSQNLDSARIGNVIAASDDDLA